MKNLIIDCSSGMTIVLDVDGKLYSRIDLEQKKHTDELLLSVDELLNSVKVSIDKIQNFCVCVGPGSFTGIRVAVSIVKGLAVNSNAKVFTLSNFNIYDTRGSKKYKIILDGFSQFVYTRTYDGGVTTDKCEVFLDVINELKSNDFDVYVQNEKLQNLLKNNKISSIIAENKINFAFNSKIASDEFTRLNEIVPVYLRASQAEIERNNRLVGGK